MLTADYLAWSGFYLLLQETNPDILRANRVTDALRLRALLHQADTKHRFLCSPTGFTRTGAPTTAAPTTEAVSYTHLTLPTICSV
eukprot:3284824-Prorocentrum_lima.AAC.1